MINAKEAREATKEFHNKDQIRRIEKVILKKIKEGKTELEIPMADISGATQVYLSDRGYVLTDTVHITNFCYEPMVLISWKYPSDE